MKTPPIAFTEDNFCAVLNGTKTETRRLLTIKGETQDEVTQISKIERNEKGNYLFLGDELKPKYNIGDRGSTIAQKLASVMPSGGVFMMLLPYDIF